MAIFSPHSKKHDEFIPWQYMKLGNCQWMPATQMLYCKDILLMWLCASCGGMRWREKIEKPDNTFLLWTSLCSFHWHPPPPSGFHRHGPWINDEIQSGCTINPVFGCPFFFSLLSFLRRISATVKGVIASNCLSCNLFHPLHFLRLSPGWEAAFGHDHYFCGKGSTLYVSLKKDARGTELKENAVRVTLEKGDFWNVWLQLWSYNISHVPYINIKWSGWKKTRQKHQRINNNSK